MKWMLFLLGLALIGTGIFVHYQWGYKDGWLIEGAFALPLVFGWLCLLLLLALHHPARRKNDTAQATTGRKIWHGTYFTIYLVWLVALVGLFLYAEHLLKRRVATILGNDSMIAYTTATITAIEERTSKTGTKYYAKIEYNALSGNVQQTIREEAGTYTPGQRLKVKYARQYPDMFVVIDAFASPAL